MNVYYLQGHKHIFGHKMHSISGIIKTHIWTDNVLETTHNSFEEQIEVHKCKGVVERTYPLSSPSTLDLVLLQNSKVVST